MKHLHAASVKCGLRAIVGTVRRIYGSLWNADEFTAVGQPVQKRGRMEAYYGN